MKSIRFWMWLLAASTLWLPSAQAHPGHGPLSHGLGHAITSPLHLGILLGTGLLLCGLSFALKNSRVEKPCRGLGMICLIAGGALWSTTL